MIFRSLALCLPGTVMTMRRPPPRARIGNDLRSWLRSQNGLPVEDSFGRIDRDHGPDDTVVDGLTIGIPEDLCEPEQPGGEPRRVSARPLERDFQVAGTT